ncbi:MAG TPA: hypothetical protein EYP19_11055, partial [Desulfobacterales bacterium]|nr:hypothetical protein [Desulfobacterales bacterium]
MPVQLDLYEVAEAYFSAPTPDKLEYERLLIRARGKAIFPLLRALLAVTIRQKKYADDLARTGRDLIVGEEFARYMWA